MMSEACIMPVTSPRSSLVMLRPPQRSGRKERKSSMKHDKTILVLLVTLVGAATLCAQQPAPPPPAAQKMEMSGKPGMMGKMDESMMAHHKEMMAKMEAMDARLDELVKKMNAASGSRKVDAVAAAVNEIVAQGKQMRTD